MRLRNIPRAENVLKQSETVMKNPSSLKGRWKEEIFHSDAPVHIEIGMGKGQFLLTLARQNPDISYIGIERYSSVLLRAVEKLGDFSSDADRISAGQDADFTNLRLICMDAAEITEVFGRGEVSRIYLNFSDPWPKARHARRRLTSCEYLDRYSKILAPDGRIEFKTDNQELFDFSVEQFRLSDAWELTECTRDLHSDPLLSRGNVLTEYEEKFSSLDHPICKLIAVHRETPGSACI